MLSIRATHDTDLAGRALLDIIGTSYETDMDKLPTKDSEGEGVDERGEVVVIPKVKYGSVLFCADGVAAIYTASGWSVV